MKKVKMILKTFYILVRMTSLVKSRKFWIHQSLYLVKQIKQRKCSSLNLQGLLGWTFRFFGFRNWHLQTKIY